MWARNIEDGVSKCMHQLMHFFLLSEVEDLTAKKHCTRPPSFRCRVFFLGHGHGRHARTTLANQKHPNLCRRRDVWLSQRWLPSKMTTAHPQRIHARGRTPRVSESEHLGLRCFCLDFVPNVPMISSPTPNSWPRRMLASHR